MTAAQVLFMHDDETLGTAHRDAFNDAHNIPTAWFGSPRECFSLAANGNLSEVTTVFLHMDLGKHNRDGKEQGIHAGTIMDALVRNWPYIRVIMLSGDYPNGSKWAQEAGAFGYCPPGEIQSWGLFYVRRGALSPQEQENRFRQLEMPRGGGHPEYGDYREGRY